MKILVCGWCWEPLQARSKTAVLSRLHAHDVRKHPTKLKGGRRRAE